MPVNGFERLFGQLLHLRNAVLVRGFSKFGKGPYGAPDGVFDHRITIFGRLCFLRIARNGYALSFTVQ